MIEVSPLQTEYNFTLPRGYIDQQGKVHRHGRMRLSTALDEIAPMKDPRVRDNQAYLTILILSRVVTCLGDIIDVTPTHVEKLFSADLAFLQDFYRRINGDNASALTVTCPHCSQSFSLESLEGVPYPGGS